MAYNAISQADHDLRSNATDSDDSRAPSPQPRHLGSFEHLALDTENLGAGHFLQSASDEDTGIRRLGSMIRSMTTASYDVVEEDDYEVAGPSAARKSNSRSSPNNSIPPLAATANYYNGEPRTPISDHSVPLSHPTPGLQSLQGAYLNNVERLEKTAERLSSSSADIGSEIRKMDLEQKRRSSGSVSNSVPISSHDPNVPGSRQGSIQSVSRLAQVSEQTLEELHHESTNRDILQPYLPLPPDLIAPTEFDPHAQNEYNGYNGGMSAEMYRPSTAASTDTYQQARFLFTDFDGVHFVPDKGSELGRRVSITRPPLASRPETYKQPRVGENMVYYPAPVPMMLNLPPRLSQRPQSSEREKRRTQLLASVPPENRKSAPWLSEQDATGGAAPAAANRRRTKQLTELPPQLRASVFFEPPATSLDIDPTQTSAVATLDSILDASTTAPVTAFTDHPFAGPAGGEVYGSSKPKKKLRPKSSFGLDPQPSNPDMRAGSVGRPPIYHKTEAQAADRHESTSLREDHRSSDSDSSTSESDGESESSESEYQFTGPPATLLAELEQRKQDLKHRRRTAANNVGGMQSTLLQLEAVAQKQSEYRRQKPVALAWENPDAHPNEEDEDDDVPLGMLFPEKAGVPDESRPLGLMEKRELEESEPLSKRRARLRGEPVPRVTDKRPMTMYSQAVPEIVQGEEDSGDEGETLAQRLRRLKTQEALDRPVSKADTDFTADILAELKHLQPEENKDSQEDGVPEEETLAQRRARLKKEGESQKNNAPMAPRYRRSMADILHARRPSTGGYLSAQEIPTQNGFANQGSLQHRMSMQQLPLNPGQSGPPKTAVGYMNYQRPNMVNPYGYAAAHPNTFYTDAILGMGHMSYAMPPNSMRPVIDPGQRELIDRWRQGIL